MPEDKPTVGERKKPGPKKGTRPAGRQKGTPNKLTASVKEMILAALEGAGGAKYLRTQADANPAAFMTLVGKVLPLQVTGADGGAIKVEHLDTTQFDDTTLRVLAAASPASETMQ